MRNAFIDMAMPFRHYLINLVPKQYEENDLFNLKTNLLELVLLVVSKMFPPDR